MSEWVGGRRGGKGKRAYDEQHEILQYGFEMAVPRDGNGAVY